MTNALLAPENRRRRRIAVVVIALLWLVLPAICYLFWGRTILEKLATRLVLPIGLMVQLLTLTLLYHFVRRSRWFWPTAFVLLAFFLATSPLVGNFAMLSLERHYEPYDAAAAEPLDAVIVLGGGLRVNRYFTVESTDDGSRALLAGQLFHARATEQIIATGSNLSGTRDHDISPGDATRILLTSLGVPEERIATLEGINTYQEMKSLRQFLDDHPDIDRYGLITSAFHLPRAMRLAHAAGIDPVPLPCCYRGDPQLLTPLDVFPEIEGLEKLSRAGKEYLAKLVGR